MHLPLRAFSGVAGGILLSAGTDGEEGTELASTFRKWITFSGSPFTASQSRTWSFYKSVMELGDDPQKMHAWAVLLFRTGEIHTGKAWVRTSQRFYIREVSNAVRRRSPAKAA